MKRYLFFLAALTWALFPCGNMYGQLLGGCGFLGGYYLEIGIAPNGSLGGGPPVPAGYHPSGTLNAIGARFDGGRDGWTVGTPPAYSDFMMRGTAFEGWSIQANGVRYDAYYSMGAGDGTAFSPGLTGDNINNAGSYNQWKGSCDGLSIIQYFRVDAYGSYMTTTVLLENTTAAAIQDVYFWRSANSAGDQVSPVEDNTVNRIIYQNDVGHKSLVVAEGGSDPNARFGYGAADSRAKVMMYDQWAPYPANIAGNSLDRIYNQTAASLGSTWYDVGGTVPATQDIAIGIIFKIGTIPPGGSATFSYITTFGDTTTIDSVRGAVDLCMGNTVTLPTWMSGATWISDNEMVATVSNTGVVTGVSEGSATITQVWLGFLASVDIVIVNATPAAIGAGGASVCAGSIITLSNAIVGGTWSSGNDTIASVTSAGVVTGASEGVVDITYGLPSCAMYITTLTVLPAMNMGIIEGPSLVCVGSTTWLSDTVSGGIWSSSNTGVADVGSDGMVTGLVTGGVTISYTIASSCGVTAVTKDMVVADIIDAGVISGPDHVCEGASITLSNEVMWGAWSSASSAASVSEAGVVTGLNAGIAVISYYIVSNVCGTTTATMTVTVAAGPPLGNITGQDTVCVGAIVQLSESTAGGVWSCSNDAVATWANASAGLLQAMANGSAEILYSVTGTNGCTSVATFTIAVVPLPFAITAAVTQIDCYGNSNGSIAVSMTGNATACNYMWSTGAATSSLMGLDTGQYLLKVTDPLKQCYTDSTFVIVQPDSIVIIDLTRADLCGRNTGAVTLMVTGGTPAYSYMWGSGAVGSILQNLHAGVYSVTVTDINNCMEQHIATVADSACSAIVVHDVITPNGDGINDVWIIEGITGYPNSVVQIFDKWGDRVYEQTGYANDWNGAGKSGLLPDGTYYYLVRLNATNAAGGTDMFTGSIMIKR